MTFHYGIFPRLFTQPYLSLGLKQESLPGEFRKRETRHFVIYHRNESLADWLETESEDDLEMIAEDLDADISSMMSKGKFTITIARTPREYKELVPLAPSNSHGAAPEGHRIVINQMEAREYLHMALAHELTHHVYADVTDGGKHIPDWVDEGLACYEESKIDNFDLLMSKDMVKNAYQTRSLASLSTMHNDYKLQEETKLFYSESTCAVDFLIESHGMRKFLEFSRILESGQTLDYAFSSVYSPDINSMDEFEKKWIASIK